MKNPFKKKIAIISRLIDGEEWFKFNKDFEKVRYFYGNLITMLLIVVLVVLATVMFLKVFPYINLLRTNPCRLCENLGYICTNPFT